MQLEEIQQYCPYCGEPLTLLIDDSEPEQVYVEDCQVCCCPMLVSVSIDADQELVVTLRREDE